MIGKNEPFFFLGCSAFSKETCGLRGPPAVLFMTTPFWAAAAGAAGAAGLAGAGFTGVGAGLAGAGVGLAAAGAGFHPQIHAPA